MSATSPATRLTFRLVLLSTSITISYNNCGHEFNVQPSRLQLKGHESRAHSPWRNRPIEESLRLFEDMRFGRFVFVCQLNCQVRNGSILNIFLCLKSCCSRGKIDEGKATLRLKFIMDVRSCLLMSLLHFSRLHIGSETSTLRFRMARLTPSRIVSSSPITTELATSGAFTRHTTLRTLSVTPSRTSRLPLE